MVIGFLSVGILTFRRRTVYGLSRPQAFTFTVLVLFSAMLGTKLLYVIESWEHVAANGVRLTSGFSLFGSIFLVPPAMWLTCRMYKMGPAKALDAAAPCAPLMFCIMRFACFLNGCCGGWETHIGAVAFRWPTQIMESFGDLMIFMWLLSHEKSEDRQGSLYPMMMVGYGALRFGLEFLRDTQKDWLYLSHGQWFSVIAMIIGLTVIVRHDKQTRRKAI